MTDSNEYSTIIDRVGEGEVRLEDMDRVGIDRGSVSEVAKGLVDHLSDYDFQVVHADGTVIIRVELEKFTVLIVPLGSKRILSGSISRLVLEKARELISGGKRTVLIYYTPGGRLLTSAYLFLGHLIEKHKIGILFVNGGPSEVVEVLKHLAERGEFKSREEDYVKIL